MKTTNATKRDNGSHKPQLVARWVEEPASASAASEGGLVTRGRLALRWFVEPEVELVWVEAADGEMKRAG